MLSKVIAPYVKPSTFFYEYAPRKIDIRVVFLAACVLGSVPLLRIGLGNLLGILPGKFFEEYAVIFAFSLWQKPAQVLPQQVLLLPVYMLGLFVYGGALHILLWLAQGVRASYPATLRCLCVAVPCMYLTVLPYSGTVAAVIYCSMFLGYSLKATHMTRWSRVLPVLAVNVPVLFLVCRILFP